jgi:hypothetical protein
MILAFDFGSDYNFLYFFDKVLNALFMIDLVLTFFVAT